MRRTRSADDLGEHAGGEGRPFAEPIDYARRGDAPPAQAAAGVA
jgi:hypothetical protein